jgi:flagellar basal-body rod protein FlgB
MDGEALCSEGFRNMLDDVTSTTLATALSAVSLQQRTSANNLANLETPGYQAQQVSFADSLRSAVAAGDPASAKITVAGTGDPDGANGNNVSLSNEMLVEQKATTQYQLLSSAISQKYDLLSTVIKG